MIKAVLILNTAGKVRLLSFYEKHITLAQQQELVRRIHRAIARRGDELCNFVDHYVDWPTPDTRIIYRRYATLAFVFVTDSSESQLAILDLIQVFVETLDRVFENVCELDLIFHSDKVQHVLMEMVMGGMVLEMSREEIVRNLADMTKLSNERSSNSGGAASSSSSSMLGTTSATTHAARSFFGYT